MPDSDHTTKLPKLAAPAHRALASLDIQTLNDLTRFTETHISQLHGIGPNALKSLKLALTESGLTFKPD